MKYIIAIILFASTAIAENNIGTLVIAPIRPQASNDTFPSAIANEIKGGPFSVATTTAMSNIPTERLVAGSLAYVTNDGLFRIYDGTNWSLTNIQNAFSISNIANLSNVSGVLSITNGGTGATNGQAALTNLGIVTSFQGIRIGTTNNPDGFGVSIGASATNTLRGVAIGDGAKAVGNGQGGVAVGYDAHAVNGGFAGGDGAYAAGQGGAIGMDSSTELGAAVGADADSIYGAAVGRLSKSTNGGAVGHFATSINGFAGGENAVASATNSSQIGTGTNTNNNTLQFLSAGSVDTNEWAALASAGTIGTNLLRASTDSNARAIIGLAATNSVEFSGIFNNGDFTNNSGTIYGLKTNVGPFEGVGNFFASNNTTVSNETLFRVGLAEQTNRSAQFGFRVARTNNGGEGVAVFSVFGYNALMMIGPSDRSRSNSITNTNAGIEADIWSISPTNKVMTLITTNTGAMEMHRPIGFNTTGVATNPPADTTNVVGWIEMYVGTNSVRVPYYQ